jgi:hypothetical protein
MAAAGVRGVLGILGLMIKKSRERRRLSIVFTDLLGFELFTIR